MSGIHLLLVLMALGFADPPQPADVPTPPPPPSIDLARHRELLLNQLEPSEQSAAALLIVQDSSREAAEIIREGLRRWDRPDVFRALASALRLRRDPRFNDLFLRALGSEQNTIRSAAIESLAKCEDDTLVKKLHLLADDVGAPLTARQAAVVTMGRSTRKLAVPNLIHLLGSESASVRQAALAALEEQTGSNYGLQTKAWETWWDSYKDMTESDWLAFRSNFHAERARRLGSDLHRAEEEILRLQQQLYVRTPAADRVSYLQALTQNEFPIVRSQAIKWILENVTDAGPTPNKQLIDLLLQLSDDGVEVVQRDAVLALEKMNDPRVFERLLALLQTGSVPVRAAAARSLGGYRREQAARDALQQRMIGALETALKDNSLVVVAEAVESLGNLRTPEVAPIVAGMLKHPSDPVRQAAAKALEYVATPPVVNDLYRGLEDPVANVRLALVAAIERLITDNRLDERQRLEALKRLELVLTSDGDPGVRSGAAFTLGKVGGPTELPVLWQRITANEDTRVKEKASKGIMNVLARSGNYALVQQWDQTMTLQGQNGLRVDVLTELRSRWAQQESTRSLCDNLVGLLIQAHLAQRHWPQAQPLIMELVKRAPNEALLKERLRWLYLACTQAMEDKRPEDVLQWIKDVEDLLSRARDLAPEFEALRQRAQQVARK